MLLKNSHRRIPILLERVEVVEFWFFHNISELPNMIFTNPNSACAVFIFMSIIEYISGDADAINISAKIIAFAMSIIYDVMSKIFDFFADFFARAINPKYINVVVAILRAINI